MTKVKIEKKVAFFFKEKIFSFIFDGKNVKTYMKIENNLNNLVNPHFHSHSVVLTFYTFASFAPSLTSFP